MRQAEARSLHEAEIVRPEFHSAMGDGSEGEPKVEDARARDGSGGGNGNRTPDAFQ